METLSFLIRAYLYFLIYENLTGEKKESVKWCFLLSLGVAKCFTGFNVYINYIWPFFMLTILIIYSICINSIRPNLKNIKLAIVTYGIDYIFSIAMGSIFGAIVGGVFRIKEINWTSLLLSMARVIFIVALCKRKVNLNKIKQPWILNIFMMATAVLLFAEQVIRFGYATNNHGFLDIAISCTYIAALFTILWLLDHFKMIKIQNEYADDNRQMSQKLHRSKEILPLLADYISGMEEIPDEKLREKLQEVCRDYGKELGAIEMSPALFHTTGIELVDLLIQNKVEECRRRGIEMDVFVGTTIEEDMERLDISDGELVRMIADLLRNAINAVKDMEEAVILTVVARDEHGNVEIDIHDSGKPFPPEILEKFGERGNTTWGTGNGIADLMESLRRVNASIEIIPEEEPDDVFTKQICIRFDGEGEVKVKKDQVSA